MSAALDASAARRVVGGARRVVWNVAAVLLCVAGAWLCATLVKQQLGRVWQGPSTAHSVTGWLCNAGQAWGLECARGAHGPWSEVPLKRPAWNSAWGWHWQSVRVPVAFLGLAYFVFLGAWLIAVGMPGRARGVGLVPLVVTGGGLLVSAGLVAAMAAGTQPKCALCLLVHLVNLLLALTLWLPAPVVIRRPFHDAAPVPPRAVLAAVGGAAVLLGVIWEHRALAIALRNQGQRLMPYRSLVESLQADPAFLLREFDAQTVVDLPGGRSAGRVVVFSDFTCSACRFHWRRQQEWLAPLRAAGARVDVRHYPLCRSCNPHVNKEGAEAACRAAYVAAAIRLQADDDTYLQSLDWLYARRGVVDNAMLADAASRWGLDANRLETDAAGPLVRQIVAEDVALARRLGVNATPTIFLDGRRVPDLCNTQAFWAAVATRPPPGSVASTALPGAARGGP